MLLALFALSQLSLAATPPACTKALTGVLWNFGTDEAPELKRCDGTEYKAWVPKGAVKHSALAPALSVQPDFNADEKKCSLSCDAAAHDCNERHCDMDVAPRECRDRCNKVRLNCRETCSKKKDK